MTNYFRKLYKYKKNKWVNETLEEATPENMWKLQGWLKSTRNYLSPVIKKQDSGMAIEHGDKCNALRDALFKPLSELENNEEPDLSRAQECDYAHVKVTQKEVRKVIY